MRGLAITDGAITALNNTYERSLVSMHKMPRVWLEYLVRRGALAACAQSNALGTCMQGLARAALQEFLVEQGMITHTRRAFDRALCALPITQHDRIWQLYLVRPRCMQMIAPTTAPALCGPLSMLRLLRAEVPDAAGHPDGDGGARVQALPAPGAQPHGGVHRLPQVQGMWSRAPAWQPLRMLPASIHGAAGGRSLHERGQGAGI